MLRALAIDFNSYFASVEQQDRPELRGKPLIIVAVQAETTGAIAVSLEAKALGLERNVRVAEARRQIPGLLVVESRPEVYIRYHRRLREIVETCVPVAKIQSIDELECELSGSLRERPKAEALARKIKAAIAREIGPHLRSSIGIGPNWLIAKLASDLQKPDGLVTFDEDELPAALIERGVALEDLTGIGENMKQRLRAAGITDVAQLYASSSARLRAIWGGVVGARFYELLRGKQLDREPVQPRSIGHGHVLPPKLRTPAGALGVLHRLLQKAAMRLRGDGFYAGALHVSVHYANHDPWAGDCRFNETQDTIQLTHALNQIWARRPREHLQLAPLQIGVMLYRLLPAGDHTPDLFSAPTEAARAKLFAAVDQLNKTFGKNSVYLGGAHGATDHAPMRIAFTRIPQPELEEIDRSLGRRLAKRKPAPSGDQAAPGDPSWVE
ncbi:MAG: DNA polymerase [Opitutaceae bacterium]|nr:DNA polymerase [Opitutaceae bacterium]